MLLGIDEDYDYTITINRSKEGKWEVKSVIRDRQGKVKRKKSTLKNKK